MTRLRLPLILLLIIFCSSCVSSKRFRELEEKVNRLEKRPYFQIDDDDGDGLLNYYDDDIDGDGIVNGEDNDIDNDELINSLDSCPAVKGPKSNNGCPD